MRKKFYQLKKVKVRQSWNKYNLYNLSRVRQPRMGTLTFFQQKWASKAATRAYHGETVREGHWQNMFRSSIRSVVSMNPRDLANSDGSEQALGRGSGLDLAPNDKPYRLLRTPYMNMVYAPMERRLDTAIFRALFASSTRQARQFVVHGYVKVNGHKMIYPGYQLNPGDMFQVEPERVLYATGAPKDRIERRKGRLSRAGKLQEKQKRRDQRKKVAALASASEESESESLEKSESPGTAETASEKKDSLLSDPKADVLSLMAQAKTILSTDTSLTAKKKQELRDFKRILKRTLSKSASSASTTLTDSLEAQLLELTSRFEPSPSSTSSSAATSTSLSDQSQSTSSKPENITEVARTLPAHERRLLEAALQEARDNPIDPRKPYATPWRPREWMSPFAFIPRYLEVHQKICSAVYLRHPVARPGFAEVPTPFPAEINGLAFIWYLRRR